MFHKGSSKLGETGTNAYLKHEYLGIWWHAPPPLLPPASLKFRGKLSWRDFPLACLYSYMEMHLPE